MRTLLSLVYLIICVANLFMAVNNQTIIEYWAWTILFYLFYAHENIIETIKDTK